MSSMDRMGSVVPLLCLVWWWILAKDEDLLFSRKMPRQWRRTNNLSDWSKHLKLLVFGNFFKFCFAWFKTGSKMQDDSLLQELIQDWSKVTNKRLKLLFD